MEKSASVGRLHEVFLTRTPLSHATEPDMRRMVLACAALTLVAPARLPAQSFLERMDVHGYGGWSISG